VPLNTLHDANYVMCVLMSVATSLINAPVIDVSDDVPLNTANYVMFVLMPIATSLIDVPVIAVSDDVPLNTANYVMCVLMSVATSLINVPVIAVNNSYRSHLCRNGVGEGTVDFPPGQCFPLESNLAFLNGGMLNSPLLNSS